MSLELHTISLAKGTKTMKADRLKVGFGTMANAAGGAGVAVTTTVTPGGEVTTAMVVLIDPHQDATWYTTNYTATTFDVVLTPRLAANALAAGTFSWMLHG